MNLVLIKFIEILFILLNGSALMFISYFIGITDNHYVYYRILPKWVKPIIKLCGRLCLLVVAVLLFIHVGILKSGLTVEVVLYLVSIEAIGICWANTNNVLTNEDIDYITRNDFVLVIAVLISCSFMFWLDMMMGFK